MTDDDHGLGRRSGRDQASAATRIPSMSVATWRRVLAL
jgi:hypothetical protein